MIYSVAVVHAFSCITVDIYFLYNHATTYSLAHVLRTFDIFLNWLQIDHLNGFELFFLANTLMVHLIMQLYLLILYLLILDCNTIKSYRYVCEVIHQVAIGLHECRCINKIYQQKSIHNLHGYSIDSYIIHGGQTVPIVRNRDKAKLEENDNAVDIVIKLIENQFFSILFYYYIIFLQILMYDNLLASYVAKDAWFNSGSIVTQKNINVPNTICYNIPDTMDYLHSGWLNLFGLLKRNNINILIVFIGFANSEAVGSLIIMDEYNLMYFVCDCIRCLRRRADNIITKKIEKNDEQSLIWSSKKAKSYKK